MRQSYIRAGCQARDQIAGNLRCGAHEAQVVLPGIAQYSHRAIALQHNVLMLPPGLIY